MANKKFCPYCGGPVVMLSSIDVKLCADCKKELPWVLSENETSIFGDRIATSKNDTQLCARFAPTLSGFCKLKYTLFNKLNIKSNP